MGPDRPPDSLSGAGLYLHVPFCRGKCRYCHFYSVGFDDPGASRFLAALDRELVRRAPDWQDRVFRTLYVGGGTPTLLAAAELAGLVGRFAGQLRCAFEEATVEANPEGLTREGLAVLRRGGFDRLSLGAQSFAHEDLALLGRRHTPQETGDAFRAARAAGFENIGLDLIFGVASQDLASWQRTLRAACALAPEHLSIYGLDPGSDGADLCAADEVYAEQYAWTLEFLDRRYECYEIANFSRPGRRCRHNENYWRRGPYLGLGPSAHSFEGSTRCANASDLAAYCAALEAGRLPPGTRETLTADQARLEEKMLGLRTAQGCPAELFTDAELAPLIAHGLVHRTGDRVALTNAGRLLADRILLSLT